ncbi:hypothetical protein Dimus_017898, partial [Dionaea muscipula]
KMSDPRHLRDLPSGFSQPAGDLIHQAITTPGDPLVPLANLSAVRSRMDSLQRFLSDSVNANTILAKDQMDMVSAEIVSAIHQAIVNGAALLTSSASAFRIPNLRSSQSAQCSQNHNLINDVLIGEAADEDLEEGDGRAEEESDDYDYEVVELDAVELLAEHIHFCEVCGKGFKRDANLRMHMRAHGDQFKTPEALAKPETCPPSDQPHQHRRHQATGGRKTRFSCPFVGCNRNQQHKKFRALKSVICVKNHFKRSHCPKMYSCNRCNKKNFSVLADLKSHLKHCGESKWRCSCGTSFSRKDKLFGHMALFEGHMPAIADDDEKSVVKSANLVVMMEEDEDEDGVVMPMAQSPAATQCGVWWDGLLDDGLLERFGSVDDYHLQDILESSSDFNF